MKKIIECVPNFSEGKDKKVIDLICASIEAVDEVRLLNVDMGAATNRTVVTFVGSPEGVEEAAFQAIKTAAELIDMKIHKGEHPRFGATDVCPFIPVANVGMDECIEISRKVGKRVGEELKIPVYLYEYSATADHRKNLANIRAGEYEGIATKIKLTEWKPDFGSAEFNIKSGNVAIGARDFLIAYNVNLNTTSTRRANSVAFDVREAGRKVKNEQGLEIQQSGWLKHVKGIGWYIEEYGIAQVSMNLTNIRETPLHIAFDACVKSAYERGMRVTGSELVGLVPLQSMLDAGKFFLEKQHRSTGVSDIELIKIAIKSMGLDELAPFDPQERIIEYKMAEPGFAPLVNLSLSSFSEETASESPAPGGGSVSAYLGALGVSLATMVANLSAHKKGWDDRWKDFSNVAELGQKIRKELLYLVDEDTRSFNDIMNAFSLPKGNEAEKTVRKLAIQNATKRAMEIPFRVMELSLESFDLIESMVEKGNPNSLSDVGVAALCARSAVYGAFLNVRINASGFDDKVFSDELISKGELILKQAIEREEKILSKMV